MNHSKARRQAERASKFTSTRRSEDETKDLQPSRGEQLTSGREWDSESVTDQDKSLSPKSVKEDTTPDRGES